MVFKMEEKQEIEFSAFWDPENPNPKKDSVGKERVLIHPKKLVVFDKFGEEGEFDVREKGTLTLEWKNRGKFRKKVLQYYVQQNEIAELSRSVLVQKRRRSLVRATEGAPKTYDAEVDSGSDGLSS
eukprot:TRINITY_DN3422_c0_g1_i1.p1 TRINITY_DN3422_c0_g1~~TRINITY_DN3422_c0_g1_i1.p1  ORF type:complete len:126 (+),score=20.94 TRINITY_DN3422_c0_g1_i1:14-391(+)